MFIVGIRHCYNRQTLLVQREQHGTLCERVHDSNENRFYLSRDFQSETHFANGKRLLKITHSLCSLFVDNTTDAEHYFLITFKTQIIHTN